MSNYYCLMTGAPALSMDNPSVVMGYAEFRAECEEVLSKADKKLLQYAYLKFDCQNLLEVLKYPDLVQLELTGLYSKEQLHELIEEADASDFKVPGYPEFMVEFVRDYRRNKDKSGYISADVLMNAYYQYAMQCPNEFISRWYKLNFLLSNILTAIIARKYGWNVSSYVMGDNEIIDLLKNSKAKDFDLTREYDFVAELMKIAEISDPVEKEKQLDVFKWQWLEEQTFFTPFGIEAVFAYLMKMELLLRWDMLDEIKGKKTFTSIIETLRSEAKVPDEFKRK